MREAQGTMKQLLKLWAFFICANLFSSAVLAENSYWLCRRIMEVRTLRLSSNEISCQAWYTKEGRDERVADTKDVELCRSIILKIKSTLESANWKCKDISNSQITH